MTSEVDSTTLLFSHLFASEPVFCLPYAMSLHVPRSSPILALQLLRRDVARNGALNACAQCEFW